MLDLKKLKSYARNIILIVCGRGAWEAMCRTIKAETSMLHILYPDIVITDAGISFWENDKDVLEYIETNIPFMMKQTKFEIRYLVMSVYYAHSDTERN